MGERYERELRVRGVPDGRWQTAEGARLIKEEYTVVVHGFTTHLVLHKAGSSCLHLQFPHCIIIRASSRGTLVQGPELSATDLLVDLTAARVTGVGYHRHLRLHIGYTSYHALHHHQVSNIYSA